MGLIDNSPYYLEILQLILKNKSSRYISKYLKDKYDFKISHVSLSKFKKENTDIPKLIKEIEERDEFIYNNKPKEIEFIPHPTSKEDILETVSNEIDVTHKANELIVNKINDGIDVLNLIRDGLSEFEDADVFHKFFSDESEVSLKDKMDMGVKLIKMGIDWDKVSNTNINIHNNNNNLSLYNTDLSELFKEPIDWSDNSDG